MKTIICVIFALVVLFLSTPVLSNNDVAGDKNDRVDKATTMDISGLDEETLDMVCGGSCGGIPFRFCAARTQDNYSKW